MKKTLQLNGKDLRKIGFPEGRAIGVAIQVMQEQYPHYSKKEALFLLNRLRAQPETYSDDEKLGPIAQALQPVPAQPTGEISLNTDGAQFSIFGKEGIEEGALNQMYTAVKLPVAVKGALMPDAHHGYGLPIGGVLATADAVIPYGVGVDIGCRMCLSIFPMAEGELGGQHKRFKNILVAETLFGSGNGFKKTTDDPILENEAFNELPLLKGLQAKAAAQLGSSGSGNHFVEWGIVDVGEWDEQLKVAPGRYVALLSHSGSRGLGATIAQHYTKVAMQKRKLPQEAKHLAWLRLDENEGQEYWLAMSLAGDYASACHHTIHRKIAKALGEKPIAMVENHHNFAWKEMHGGRELIVHRKGATPAGKGVLGIIPGSMTLPGFIVRGKGDETSLSSASHGAGRLLSRTKAKQSLTWNSIKALLEEHNVELIGGGLDEAPQAYKDIRTVMAAQESLVDTIGTFYPRIVRMDGA